MLNYIYAGVTNIELLSHSPALINLQWLSWSMDSRVQMVTWFLFETTRGTTAQWFKWQFTQSSTDPWIHDPWSVSSHDISVKVSVVITQWLSVVYYYHLYRFVPSSGIVSLIILDISNVQLLSNKIFLYLNYWIASLLAYFIGFIKLNHLPIPFLSVT